MWLAVTLYFTKVALETLVGWSGLEEITNDFEIVVCFIGSQICRVTLTLVILKMAKRKGYSLWRVRDSI